MDFRNQIKKSYSNEEIKVWAAQILMHKMLGKPLTPELQEKYIIDNGKYARDIKHYENEDNVKDTAIKLANDYISKVLEKDRPLLRANLDRWKDQNRYGLLSRNGIFNSTANLTSETRNRHGRGPKPRQDKQAELRKIIMDRHAALSSVEDRINEQNRTSTASTSTVNEIAQKAAEDAEFAAEAAELAEVTKYEAEQIIDSSVADDETKAMAQDNITLATRILAYLRELLVRFGLMNPSKLPKEKRDFCPRPANPVTRLATRHQAFKR